MPSPVAADRRTRPPLFTMAILLPGLILWALPVRQTGVAGSGTEASCGGEPLSGCTVFTAAKGKKVFFGGNDDWITPDSYYSTSQWCWTWPRKSPLCVPGGR
jgi:hypothetical protein